MGGHSGVRCLGAGRSADNLTLGSRSLDVDSGNQAADCGRGGSVSTSPSSGDSSE